jgi:hypothetical protein
VRRPIQEIQEEIIAIFSRKPDPAKIKETLDGLFEKKSKLLIQKTSVFYDVDMDTYFLLLLPDRNHNWFTREVDYGDFDGLSRVLTGGNPQEIDLLVDCILSGEYLYIGEF